MSRHDANLCTIKRIENMRICYYGVWHYENYLYPIFIDLQNFQTKIF